MDTQKLISLKENFTGQKFQWIKTDRPELLGKVVKCRDIDFGRAPGTFIAIFEDGSSIDTSKLNSNLLMLHGDMKALSKEEVEMIYPAKKPQTPPPPITATPSPPPIDPPKPTMKEEAPLPEPANPPAQSKPNMFSIFNSEETQISLTLNVKLPEKKLLKMMYASAENKEQFLEELSDYFMTLINKKVVSESMRSILASPPQKIQKPAINVTPVQ